MAPFTSKFFADLGNNCHHDVQALVEMPPPTYLAEQCPSTHVVFSSAGFHSKMACRRTGQGEDAVLKSVTQTAHGERRPVEWQRDLLAYSPEITPEVRCKGLSLWAAEC
jgi:hypothetical protein